MTHSLSLIAGVDAGKLRAMLEDLRSKSEIPSNYREHYEATDRVLKALLSVRKDAPQQREVARILGE